jgi:TatD DNase family protein
MYVDSHCHLNYPDFADDLSAVIARAHGEGVELMQTICTKMEEFPAVRAVAEGHERIYCSVGVHPHHAGEGEMVTTAQLVAEAAHPKVIGIGETGLDFYYEHSPRDKQEESFRRHIAASRQTGLPTIIHTRDADEETIAILKNEMTKGAFPGLIHCFSTSAELAQAAVEMGFYISVAGIVTFKKAEALREAIKTLPLERLLIETDAPYLAPTPHRGQRNEPAFVVRVAEVLGELKGMKPEAIGKATTENFFRLFQKLPQTLWRAA